MKEYITFDISPSVIRHAFITEEAILSEVSVLDTPRDGKDIIHEVCSVINEAKKDHDIQGVCIATAGLVDHLQGIVFYAPDTMPGYAPCEWKKIINEECALPAAADNRINCMGMAEYVSGAAYGASSCLLVMAGKSAGGCFIMDGKIFRGHSSGALEVEYLPMYGSTFGELATSSALERKVAAIKGNMNLGWDSARIFEEAAAGDKECAAAVEELCDITGRAIATVCYILNPETVVLCGSIMTGHRDLLPKVRTAMEKYLIDPLSNGAFIASSSHGENGALSGAFYHFIGTSTQSL